MPTEVCFRSIISCLLATLALGAAFLMVKCFEYSDDISKSFVPGPHFPLHPAETEIFWTLYWVMTDIQAVHLIIGLGAVSTATYLLARR